MRFGVIGTNWITDHFIEAAQHHPEFTINAVYSRTLKRAKEFASKYDVTNVYDDLQQMFTSGHIDAVYIASPNKFHAEQSMLAMENGIHVLCEKPAVTTVEEMDQIIETSKKHGVTFMEAMKSTVTPTFLNIKKHLDEVGQIRRFVFQYNQYSSRYDKLKAGIVENAFKPELGNGAHMDLGVYCIAPLLHLAGEPKAVLKNNHKLYTGAEGMGSMICQYDNFEAVIMYSKIMDSFSVSEIQGERAVIEIDRIDDPKRAILRYRDGKTKDLSVHHQYPTMYYEVEEFIRCVNHHEISSPINSHKISRQTIKLLSTSTD